LCKVENKLHHNPLKKPLLNNPPTKTPTIQFHYVYEETKNLTHKQYNERVRKIGEAAAKKYGFQRVTSTKENKILMTQKR